MELLQRERLGGVLLNAQHNFAWITGGASNGIDLSRENGAASILITVDGSRYLVTNNVEMPRLLAEEVSSDLFEPVEYAWQDEKVSPDLVVEKATAIAAGEIATDIAIGTKARAIEGRIAQCRFSLTRTEIERVRELGKDAARALDNVAAYLVPGQSETEIARKMQTELGSFRIASVVTLVAADERIAQYRHPIPTEKKWEKTLLLVTCAKRKGLIVSLSRMLRSGSVPDDLRRRTEAAVFVNASLWNATQPGVTGAELYNIASRAYEASGFAGEIDKHHQGGAAGYKTREWVAHPDSGEIVQNNQAFAWNPSITGTKVEETILIHENEIEVLTASEDFPKIPIEIDGTTYYSPGILSV